MPFTLAHPAAALPFRRLAFFATIPLIIGTLVPDLVRILPQRLLYAVPGVWRLPDSHRLLGSVVTDLLFGYALLLALIVLRAPLLSPLWNPHRSYIRDAFAQFLQLRRWWLIAIPSLLVGAWTHLAWDAFTHESWLVTRHMPTLQNEIFPGDDHPLPIFHVLQYLSSVFGIVAVGLWYRSALRKSRAFANSFQTTAKSNRNWRKYWLVTAIAASFFVGIAITASRASEYESFYEGTSAILKRGMFVFGVVYVITGAAICCMQACNTMKARGTE